MVDDSTGKRHGLPKLFGNRTGAILVAEFIVPGLVGSILTLAFWWPLALGGGFIGGDVYNYFFPLKDYYAEGLREGHIRTWHARIGNGVPLVGEGQTAPFYPPNVIAYRCFDLATAYNAVHGAHYLFAFLAAYWLGRTLSIGRLGSHLLALVFTFGWFPARSSLEWAIVTGSWMPLVILFEIRWIQTRRVAWGIALVIAMGAQLLAGHFQLAFVTILAALWLAITLPIGGYSWKDHWRLRLAVPGLLALGFLLAAPQVFSTWELRSVSQRVTERFAESTGYGGIPPLYLVSQQLFLGDERELTDQYLNSIKANTNRVEASFHLGWACVLLLMLATAARWWRWQALPWFGLVVVSLLVATGVLMPFLKDLPGFSFFRYPSRYSLAAQLGLAVLVGMAGGALRKRLPWVGLVTLPLVLVATAFEYEYVGRHTSYVDVLPYAPIAKRDASIVAKHLSPIDRVLAPDPNTLSLIDVAAVPTYLGLGPELYEEWRSIDGPFDGDVAATPEAVELLRRRGVTHLLTFKPLPSSWPATLVWSGDDPFLNPRWKRAASEPLYLYRFDAALGRVYLEDDQGQPVEQGTVTIEALRPHRVDIDVETPVKTRVVLTDLLYPGWTVTVDGEPVEPVADSPMRRVDVPPGQHVVEWTYRDISVTWGTLVSLLTVAGLALWLGLDRRQRS
ncbi:hypothetical protein Pan216_57550 [Planctomycetes bacterium Pan216]|uniref:Bacterial membrane protein YfhO n=1 Tax=Kolteria novifilia TaxID=2527975 RepID=A0A518BD00_9BACT|nr:hypothetical protein Pan216_57550 [Planctomycetes bacterium Pan216]